MSLNVTPDLLAQAQAGKVSDADFVACIQDSLPYAWRMLAGLVGQLDESGARSVVNQEVPQSDDEWGQMFRLMASDAMRAASERHFGVRLAFQNCCSVAVFVPGADEEITEFTSPEAQVLNQRPDLRNC
jgi:hypothetical protein